MILAFFDQNLHVFIYSSLARHNSTIEVVTPSMNRRIVALLAEIALAVQ